MKKILLGLLFVTGLTNAQETEFTFDNVKGMTDYVVTPVTGKTAPEIYKKVIEWIKVTYKNPDKVILSTIDNEYIRFEGSSQALYALNIVMLGKIYYDTKYEIEINVKEGKYKFDIVGMQNYITPSKYAIGGWSDNALFTGNSPKDFLDRSIYKKDGSIKNMWKYLPVVPPYFNELNKSLFESIINGSTDRKSDW
jgi:hypothetical protein